jgi:hypothetical protein
MGEEIEVGAKRLLWFEVIAIHDDLVELILKEHNQIIFVSKDNLEKLRQDS